MKHRRSTWLEQIVTIQSKGYDAFCSGQPESANPYTNGYHNQNGAGGSVQRQRWKAWLTGWRLAKRENGEQCK